MRIVVQDSRVFVGYFKGRCFKTFLNLLQFDLAFDKHMNIILSECEEHRRIKVRAEVSANIQSFEFQPKPGKKLNVEEEKRVLGLILLRGDKIISMSVDGPPQKGDDDIKIPKAGKF